MDNKAKKASKKNSRKKITVFSIVSVILLATVFVVILTSGKKDSSGSKKKEEPIQNWDDRIADLENEPVSDMDVVYKEKKNVNGKPYLIQINKTQNCIIIYKKGSNDKYNEPVRAMICSVGFDTPEGEFTISDKYEWKIVNGNVWSQYATRVVGNVLIHSMPYAANSKDTLLPNYYNQLGSTLSAGCIRVSAKDAKWIMENCPAGTKVHIYESDSVEPLERPQAIVVPEDARWDPTDPDGANPYHGVNIGFEGVEAKKTVERGTQINYMSGISIKDTCGNDLSSQVKVTSKVEPFKTGTYEVQYYAEDAAGKTAQASTIYQIVDTMAPQFSGVKTTMNFASVSDVTKDNILKGVAIIDNNEILDNSRISVVIPAVMEGGNAVTLSATDDYGNTATININAVVHVKPPAISLKPGMESILPLTQKVDTAYALSRVTAVKDGVAIPADKITVSITPSEWGYSLRYTVTDENGYIGVLDDSVTYVEYRITPPANLVVTDINDKSQLIKDVVLKNNLGGSLEPSSLTVTAGIVSGNQYRVTYSYTYSSPVGSRTATAEAIVTLEGGTGTEPVESGSPQNRPVNSGTPETSAGPEPAASAQPAQ